MRHAIAMIELIFAVVIMGIVLMSAPMLITTATKSAQTAFQQESIAMTAAHANALMSYAWDEQNTQSQLAGQVNEILHTDSSNQYLNDRNASHGIRDYSQNIAASTNFGPGVDRELNGQFESASNKDDIDDFDGTATTLLLLENSSASAGGYMDTQNTISTAVTYGNDNANYSACSSNNGCAFSQPFASSTPAGTSNIKRVTVDFSSIDTDTQIKLKFFMCNIGAASPEKRTF